MNLGSLDKKNMQYISPHKPNDGFIDTQCMLNSKYKI